nr:hypothetical protein Iba_chr02dCG9000 [Ipomoea batatas]
MKIATVEMVAGDDGRRRRGEAGLCVQREGLDEISFTHVLKEGNKRIDFLASLGLSREWGTSVLDLHEGDIAASCERCRRCRFS